MVKILYIEDDPSLQRALKRALERDEDTSVTVVGDAKTAIKLLETSDILFGCFHFDHILCDYDLLDGTNGGQVLEWIKRRTDDKVAHDNGVLKSPRQVYLERFTFLAANEAAMELHDRYIEKPANVATIRQALVTKGPIRIIER